MAGKKAKPKKVVKKLDYHQLKAAAVLCPICRTILIEPVTLPCDHAFCKQCFEGTMENANLTCPLCRLRVGSWFRRAKKDGKVVDQEFWKAIQQQYAVEVRNKHQGIDNGIEDDDKPIIKIASPGEIRKEYERERQKDMEEQTRIREAEERASNALIKKLKEKEEYQRQVEEEKLRLDAILAKKLTEELSTPSTSRNTPRKSEISRKYGPMDRFIKSKYTPSNRKISNKSYPIRTHKMNSPKRYTSKEYTCQVLSVEQSPLRVNRTTNLFADLDLKEIFSSLGQKPTKTINPDRGRRSISLSGYHSSSSGDNSDIIDKECKFYFKPIDSQRKHHVRGKAPIKVPVILAVNDGNIPIEPPSGKTINLLNPKSAFAVYSAEDSSEETPSCNEIEESESSSEFSFKNLKRKSTNAAHHSLTRKKRTKKDLLMERENKSDTSPFFGFDNKSKRAVDRSLFYGFNVLHIEEGEREKAVINKHIARYEDALQSLEKWRYDGDPTTNKPRIKENNIDINRNIPNSSQLSNLGSGKIGSNPLIKGEKADLGIGTPSDSDAENEVLSKLIDSICNSTELTSPTNKKTSKRSAKRNNIDIKKLNPRKGKTINNIKVNGNVGEEEKRLQEESDFEFAKKLQAEFDLIQVSSRTRRGRKRQITLDEMLSV